jgi:membrane protein involved in colicin uptake
MAKKNNPDTTGAIVKQRPATPFVIDEDAVTADIIRAGVTDDVIHKVTMDANHVVDTIGDIDRLVADEGIARVELERVRRVRLDARKLRTTVEKVCKAGRDEANRIRTIWIEREKAVIAKITPAEDSMAYLEQRISDAVEAKKKREAEAAWRRGQIENRVRTMAEHGRTVTFEDMERLDDDEFFGLIRAIRADEAAAREAAAAAQRAAMAEREAQMAAERAAMDAERRRIDAERAELERLKRAEHDRVVSSTAAERAVAADAANREDDAIRDAMQKQRDAVGSFAEAGRIIAAEVGVTLGTPSIGAPSESEFFPSADRADAYRSAEIVSESGAVFAEPSIVERYAEDIESVLVGWRIDVAAPMAGGVRASSDDLLDLARAAFVAGYEAHERAVSG